MSSPSQNETFSQVEIKDDAIPAKFKCALTNKLMEKPARIVGSKFPVAYEESVLEAYFQEYGFIDPKTNKELSEDAFMPDLALKREIDEFRIKTFIAR